MCRRPSATPSWSDALEACGVARARRASTCICETGAGTRTVLVRAGLAAARRQPPIDAAARRGPALAGRASSGSTTRACPAASSPRASSTGGCGASVGAAPRLGRHRAPAAGRVRRRRAWARVPLAAPTERAAARLRRLVVLPLHRHRGDRRGAAGGAGHRGRHHVARHLAGARRRGPPRAVGAASDPGDGPIAHAQLEIDGEDALDMARAPSRAGASGVIVGGVARARAHPPRRRVLRLSRRHLRGGARAPRALRAPAHLPPPPPGVHPRDRDRGRAARPPACWPRPTCPWRPWASAWSRPTRDQGPLQGGRGPRRAGRGLAQRRVLAARRPKWRRTASACAASVASPPCRSSWPASIDLLSSVTAPAAHPPAPHRAVPARRPRAGGRGAGGHRRHRDDHAVAGHPAGPAALLARGRGAAERHAGAAPRARGRRHHARSCAPPSSSC